MPDGFKQELGGKLWLTVPLWPSTPSPYLLLSLSDGLMVSTGEIGSWLLYLDKILDPSPSLFAVIVGAVWTPWGGKGKVKAKSKGLASIHLTEWVKGNKWLSFDQLYIHLFSVTSVKDAGAYLWCTPALIKWKQKKKKRFFSSLGSLINEKLSICGRHHHASTSPPVVIIIAWNNVWDTVAEVWTTRAVENVEKCEIPPHLQSVPTHLAISSWRIF